MTVFSDQQNTLSVFSNILSRIEYPDFAFSVNVSKGGTFFFQVACKDTCNVTGDQYEWKGRKWLLSVHMTPGEIVQTAFKAVLAALEHEAREKFKYRGVSIFDPHYDIEKLVALRSDPTSIQERDSVG